MNREPRYRSPALRTSRRPGGGFHRQLERAALAFKAKHGRFPDYHRLTNADLQVLTIDLQDELGCQADQIIAFMEYQGMPLVIAGTEDDLARRAAGQRAAHDIDLPTTSPSET